MVAVINNFGGFYRTWVYVHEAIREGATVEHPASTEAHTRPIYSGTTIYMGLIHIAGLESSLANGIITERNDNGDYQGS